MKYHLNLAFPPVSVEFMSASIIELLILFECYIVSKDNFLHWWVANAWSKCFGYPLDINITVHPGTALTGNVNPLIILSFLFCSNISFSWNTIPGSTFCRPSARMQSCKVACLLSRPLEDCETHTCSLSFISFVLSWSITKGRGTWTTLYRFWGSQRPYLSSSLALFCRLVVLRDVIRFLWKSWIFSLLSLAADFFLFYCCRKAALWLVLSLWDQY